MRSSRLRDWLFGAKDALKKNPKIEDELVELDRIVTEAATAIGNLPAQARTPAVMRSLELIETFGEVTREIISASAWGVAAIPMLPYHKRALLHWAKFKAALAAPKKEI